MHRKDAVTVTRITTSAEAAYRALTTTEGIAGWWATNARVASVTGGLVELTWSDSDYTTMRIDALRPPRLVRWACIAQHDTNLPAVDEWVGSSVQFDIEPMGAADVLLTVTHEGLMDLDCGEICSAGWVSFMSGSLKPFLETGEGNPWQSHG